MTPPPLILLASVHTLNALVVDGNSKHMDAILTETDAGKAIPMILKLTNAADKGDPSAQFMLAVIYDKGFHVKQDKERADKLVQKSAEGGYPPAIYVVAEKYDRERDYSTALGWYSKAAEAGDSKSMYRLAEMYRDGKGAEKDLALFFSWVSKAANAGFPAAQYDLSLAYLKGDGCKPDFSRAYAWGRVAADRGFEKAEPALAKYKQNMPADDVAEGERIYLEIRGKLMRVVE